MSDINDLLNRYEQDFDNAEATSREPIPAGEYTATITKCEYVQTRSGKDSFRLTFRVDEGQPHAGRLFFDSLFLTSDAMKYTKAVAQALGLKSLAELRDIPPNCYRVRAKLAIRSSDGGAEFNKVRSLSLVEVVEPQPDPFGPKTGGGA